MTDETLQKAMDKAMNLLSRRGHSRKELFDKLFKRGFSKRVIMQTLSECERLNFINDFDFAESYLAELRAKGYGIYRIKNAMFKKGVPSAILKELIENGTDNEEDERERAMEALKRKMKTLEKESEPRKRKEKAYRFLAGRGFSMDVIYSVYDEFTRN
jgi:regulatory protein